MPEHLSPLAISITSFWREAGPARWFRRDAEFDALIRNQFLGPCEAALKGAHADWGEEPEGALALLLLLDQFPRNLFRGDARAFSGDGAGRIHADHAIAHGLDQRVEPLMRQFFYTPFMHSEALTDQHRSVALYTALAREVPGDQLTFAILHRDIIERFGRFPHRNPVLGREMRPEEQAYLDEGGFSA